MWWPKQHTSLRLMRIAVVLSAASLTAGCFEPLYGTRPSAGAESVHDKLGDIDIAPIPARQGTATSRLAVAMRNELQFDFNGGAGAPVPTHRLLVTLGETQTSVIVDLQSGRPTAQIDGITATYQLVEIATGKVVLRNTTFARVDTDAPGSEQRFAQYRAQRDAEDRAIKIAAEAIRNRLASYFVAGT